MVEMTLPPSLAALINLLPCRYSDAGHALPDFLECASELYHEALKQQPDLVNKRPLRQAATVVAAIATRVPEAKFISFRPAAEAFEESQLFRSSLEDSVRSRFDEVWYLAYPHLKGLLLPGCSASEAWSHAASLIGKRPSYEALAALNARVAGLIGAVDADPELRVVVASSEDRAQAMLRLLRSDKASAAAASDGTSTSDTAADEAKLLSS